MNGFDTYKTKIQLNKKNWLFIFGIWAIAQLVYLFFLGINDKGEAETYLGITSEIVNGNWKQSPNYYLYGGYIFIQLAIHFLGLSYKFVYVVQLLLSALALASFTKILALWLSSKKALIATTVLYSTCPFIQSWVSFLYTDSVFTSLLTIAIYLLIFSHYEKRLKNGLWLAIFLIPFFRPIGFLFTPIVIFYWLFCSSKKSWTNIAFASFYLVSILIFIEYAFNNSKSFFYPYHNAEANVICGLPSGLVQYIKVPYHLGISMFQFFISNPKMTFYLFSNRLLSSFWITRPFFSTIHNAVIETLLIPYYFFALTGFLLIFAYKKIEKSFLVVGIILFVTPLVLFCTDWVTRFTLPIFPFIFLLIGLGVDFWLTKIQAHKNIFSTSFFKQ